MHDMNRGARNSSHRNHFMQRGGDAGFTQRPMPHVDKGGALCLTRQLKQLLQFFRAGLRCIGKAEPDPQPAIAQPLLQQFANGDLLLPHRHPVDGVVARQPIACVLHHHHARGHMPNAGAIVDQRFPFPRRIPLRNGVHADFQLQRRGHPVARFKPVIFRSLTVRVKVDEARSDNQPLCINLLCAFQRLIGNGGDLPASDSHVPHRVQVRFGIHHAPAANYQIKRLRVNAQDGECEQETAMHGIHSSV